MELSELVEDQVLHEFLQNTRMSQRMTTLWIILDNLLNTHRGAIPYDAFATRCMERLVSNAGQQLLVFDEQMVAKLMSMLLFWYVIHSHPNPKEYMNTCTSLPRGFWSVLGGNTEGQGCNSLKSPVLATGLACAGASWLEWHGRLAPCLRPAA